MKWPFKVISHESYEGGNFHRFGYPHPFSPEGVDLNRPMVEINIGKTLKSKAFIALAAASTLLCCGGGGALLYLATH